MHAASTYRTAPALRFLDTCVHLCKMRILILKNLPVYAEMCFCNNKMLKDEIYIRQKR